MYSDLECSEICRIFYVFVLIPLISKVMGNMHLWLHAPVQQEEKSSLI